MYVIIIKYDGELIIMGGKEFSTRNEAEDYIFKNGDTLDGSKITLQIITRVELDLQKTLNECHQKI